MSYVRSLLVKNFRNYEQVHLQNLEPGFVILCGPNGAGKTNILEALSLFAPGRGLRSARNKDFQKNDASDDWVLSANIISNYEDIVMGQSFEQESEKLITQINGEKVRGQSSFYEYAAWAWLTPQMDRLFIDSSRERRRFLDRMIFSFDAGHQGRLNRFDKVFAQRSKLLREGMHDDRWLSGLEKQMAETAVAISAARIDFVERLQGASAAANDPDFPSCKLRAQGTLEELLQKASALEAEDLYIYQLKESRAQDAIVGGAATGPHKSDLGVVYKDLNMPAAQCSTGEQKALLIGLILAYARLVKAERGLPPILLLDEIAAHLDEGRRDKLYGILADLNGQIWLTGTEESLFSGISRVSKQFQILDGQVVSE